MRTTKRAARYHTLSGKKTQQGVTREERVQSFRGSTGGRTTPGGLRSPLARPSWSRFGREMAFALGRNPFFRRGNSTVNSTT